MDKQQLFDLLAQNPVIAAVKDPAGLAAALKSESRVVFTLFGDVMNIAGSVSRIKNSGRAAFVHLDLVEGLAARDVAVDFIAKNTEADGILTTKAPLTRRAAEQRLLAIQRFFALDSLSLQNIYKQLPKESACAVELLPGLMPKIIGEAARRSALPIIAGGLIREKDDVLAALGAGALAVSSSNPAVWNL